MNKRPIVAEVDCSTGEQVEREMTDEEAEEQSCEDLDETVFADQAAEVELLRAEMSELRAEMAEIRRRGRYA